MIKHLYSKILEKLNTIPIKSDIFPENCGLGDIVAFFSVLSTISAITFSTSMDLASKEKITKFFSAVDYVSFSFQTVIPAVLLCALLLIFSGGIHIILPARTRFPYYQFSLMMSIVFIVLTIFSKIQIKWICFTLFCTIIWVCFCRAVGIFSWKNKVNLQISFLIFPVCILSCYAYGNYYFFYTVHNCSRFNLVTINSVNTEFYLTVSLNNGVIVHKAGSKKLIYFPWSRVENVGDLK